MWIGSELSVMEQLCICSYLENGHPFHLYTYQPVRGVPAGTIVKDGAEILPPDEIFVYRQGYGKGSPSAFSNMFRYKLLLERGGWWSDLDAVCLRPLDFADPHVAGYERDPNGECRFLAAGLLKAPVGSHVLEYCYRACRQADKAQLSWGAIGPQLFTRAVEHLAPELRALEPEAFYPIDYFAVNQLIDGTELPRNSYSIHLWHSKWNHQRMDPNGVYRDDCIYEQLKRRFGNWKHHARGSRFGRLGQWLWPARTRAA